MFRGGHLVFQGGQAPSGPHVIRPLHPIPAYIAIHTFHSTTIGYCSYLLLLHLIVGPICIASRPISLFHYILSCVFALSNVNISVSNQIGDLFGPHIELTRLTKRSRQPGIHFRLRSDRGPMYNMMYNRYTPYVVF